MQQPNQKTVNNVKNSYTFYLEPKIQKLYAMMVNEDIPLEAMKHNIKLYIEPAKYSYQVKGQTYYTKKKWFLEEVELATTKQQLYYLCRNSVRKAKETVAH